MSARTHAQHRAMMETSPAHAAPPSLFGWLYPEGDILAVVADRGAGDLALQALERAGVPVDDIDLVEPERFLAVEQASEQHRGPLHWLSALLGVAERELAEGYRDEAQRGHPILVVHAGDRARVERIGVVLRGQGARWIRHYER